MFPFHSVQSANTSFLLMKTHRVLRWPRKFGKVRYCKTQVVFFRFTIYSRSKLIKFSTLFMRHLLEKLAKKFKRFRSRLSKLEILDIFTTMFFMKNYHLHFFQVLLSTLLKNEKEKSQKRRKPPKNCLT